MGTGYFHLNGNGKKFGANGDLSVIVGHLNLIQGLAFGGQGLGVVPHPYYAQQSGTSDHPCHGSFDNEPRRLFLVGDMQCTGDNIG